MSQSPSRGVRAVCVLALFAIALGLLAGCGGSDDDGGSDGGSGDISFEGSAYPGVDKANTRLADGSIKRDNVSGLKVAWTLPITGQGSYGAYAASPVIAKGVIYSQDLGSNVQAIDLESGEVLWQKRYEEPEPRSQRRRRRRGQSFRRHRQRRLRARSGNRQRAVVDADHRIQQPRGRHGAGLRRRARLHRLGPRDADRNLSRRWRRDALGVRRQNREKSVELRNRSQRPLGRSENQRGRRPLVPALLRRGGVDLLRHRRHDPGSRVRPANRGARAGPARTSTPTRWSSSTPRPERWTGSTSRRPHGLYDWDFQDSPILIEAEGRKLAIGAGKNGYVAAVDAENRQVGLGERGRQTQRARRRRPAGDARRRRRRSSSARSTRAPWAA